MGRIGLVHLEAITKAPGVQAVIVSNPTISKAAVSTFDVFEALAQGMKEAHKCWAPSNPCFLAIGCCEAVQYPTLHK